MQLHWLTVLELKKCCPQIASYQLHWSNTPAACLSSSTASCRPEDFPGHVGLFEPKTDFAEDLGGVMVAHSVSPTYGGKTTIHVQLINPTPVPVTLYTQEKIAFLQERIR